MPPPRRRGEVRNPRPVPPPELAVWIESYELSLTGNSKSDKTVWIYTDAVTRLGGWLHEHEQVDDWFKVTKQHMQRYMTWFI
ncbi:MAG TPA: hypothetical protein VFR11_19515, partial [Micromonosporaceae bacterium]|nr:hypothetical protein [Micromonosporaceae bacterium]